MIQDGKIMVIIAWNPLGLPLIVTFLKGRTFNAECYRNNILAVLTQLWPEDDGRNLVVMMTMQGLTLFKMSNFCQGNELRLAPHPPNSPDRTIRLLSVRLCQRTSQRNGISITRGMIRRNW
jgi:hypothetical protein